MNDVATSNEIPLISHTVVKRNGEVVEFNPDKIKNAIRKCLGEINLEKLDTLTKQVCDRYTSGISVETIQDIVEEILLSNNLIQEAKHYILFRAKKNELRKLSNLPDTKLVTENLKYFNEDELGAFVYYRTYSRYLDKVNRRETYPETVKRTVNTYKQKAKALPDEVFNEIEASILGMDVMPSMRMFASAGRAIEVNEVSQYNCSYLPIDSIKSFSEALFIMMSGTGVGFSIELEEVDKLPRIKKQKTNQEIETYIVEDSTIGWALAFETGLLHWFKGLDINFDYSRIRPAGSRLKTKGGLASGPQPLKDLLDFSRKTILSTQGNRLSPIQCHDIICKTGEIVVTGSFRRSALISLSDLEDPEMRDAKNGQFWITNPQRSMSNNSVAYEEKPSMSQFIDEWTSLMKSGSGERGIFNRESSIKHRPRRRKTHKFGLNPYSLCGINQ